MKNHPPKRALQFLRWFCREDYLEEIEGDLIELFENRLQRQSPYASYLFIWGVISHFRPDFIRSFDLFFLIHPAMLRHNLLITIRGFLRHKRTFFINLIGLSTGMACAIMLYLWASHELSMDKFHKRDQQLYEVKVNLDVGTEILTLNRSPVPLAAALKEEMPEVVEAVSVNDFSTWRTKDGIFTWQDRKLQASGYHASTDFFKVFTYPLLYGAPEQVLFDKNNIVLSEELATNLFGTAAASIGQTVHWKHPLFEGQFQVTGVFESIPDNSMDQFDFVISTDILLDNDRYASSWGGGYANTYLVLQKGTAIEAFNDKIRDYVASKDGASSNVQLLVRPFSSRYLYGRFENGKPVAGRITYVRLFSVLALFILLLACINFMNLSTAKATLKMKEIGVKKTVGAKRSTLFIQFIGESILMVLLATLLAFLLVLLLLPQFNEISGKSLDLSLSIRDYLAVLGIIVFTGLIAGSYPALYLSSFKPLSVLKGKLDRAVGALWLRKGLVTFQFAISLIFLLGLMIVNQQLAYTQNKNLGYNRNNVISIQWKGELYDQWTGLDEGKSNQTFETFMKELKNLSGVSSASNMAGNILDEIYGQGGVSWEGKQEGENISFKSPIIGYDLIETLGIEIKEGRSFSKDYNDDYSRVILNEKAVEVMQLEDPLNAKIVVNSRNDKIVGVVNNFHFGSLHTAIQPLIFRFDPNGRNIIVKLQEGAEAQALASIQKLHQKFLPGFEFDYQFMDEEYAKLYEAENRVAVLSKYLAAIAILVSCLGLLGLVAFSSERRAKEISIRRILGASFSGVLGLLAKDYARLIFIAIGLSIPIAYVLAQNWLNGFAEHIDLNGIPFLICTLALLFIAGLTIILQSLKVATGNLKEYLQSE